MNWIVRNSTICGDDWCDAKKEIERLKAQVKDYQDACHQKQEILDSQKVQIVELAKESDALRKQVAELTQAHELSHDRYNVLHMTYTEAYDQLAAMTRLWENEYRLRCEAQARIVELREALKVASIALADHGTAYLNHEDEYSTACGYVSAALATHDNTDTLDRRLQEERERCAKICLEMQQGWASDDHIECAAAIRKGGE